MPSIFQTIVTSVFNVCDKLSSLFYKPRISAHSSNIDYGLSTSTVVLLILYQSNYWEIMAIETTWICLFFFSNIIGFLESAWLWTKTVFSRDRRVEKSHQHHLQCSGFPSSSEMLGPQVKREGKRNKAWALDILYLHVDYKDLQHKKHSDAKSKTVEKPSLRVKNQEIIQSSWNHKNLCKNNEIIFKFQLGSWFRAFIVYLSHTAKLFPVTLKANRYQNKTK